MMDDFNGVKIALFYNGKLVMCHRDDKPGIPFPGMWDCPGGGREGNETPDACVIREVEEELGIRLSPAAITWRGQFPPAVDGQKTAYFMVAEVDQATVDNIVFGAEGQGWGLMTVDDFFERDDVAPYLKGRLQTYLKDTHETTS